MITAFTTGENMNLIMTSVREILTIKLGHVPDQEELDAVDLHSFGELDNDHISTHKFSFEDEYIGLRVELDSDVITSLTYSNG